MSAPDPMESLIRDFLTSAKSKLAGPGGREEALKFPVSDLMRGVAQLEGYSGCQTSEEVSVKKSGQSKGIRPDIGVRIDSGMVGFVELKAPGIPIDPKTFKKGTHNHRQWELLKDIPNLIYTNGTEWRLISYGQLIREATVKTDDLASVNLKTVKWDSDLSELLRMFFTGNGLKIDNYPDLVRMMASLARYLKEEVLEVLQRERWANDEARKKGSKRVVVGPVTSIYNSWTGLLLPGDKWEDFASGYSQAVVFWYLMAISEGLDIEGDIYLDTSKEMQEKFGPLSLFVPKTELDMKMFGDLSIKNAVDLIRRSFSRVDWEKVDMNRDQKYIYLFEEFLQELDPELRKQSGSYYTPIELTSAMVNWSDEALRVFFNRNEGLRDTDVQVVDPAMGTGTFPLSVLQKIYEDSMEEGGEGLAVVELRRALNRMYGIEIQYGSYSAAVLRLSEFLKDKGADLPEGGLNLYLGDTLEDPTRVLDSVEVSTVSGQLISQQHDDLVVLKSRENIEVVIGNPPYKSGAKGLGGWVEGGVDPKTGKSPMEAFFTSSMSKNAKVHLKNLYAYFWRWASWKAFESTADLEDGDGNGLICFVTPSAYLKGAAFEGMREYFRRNCSRGWIIDVTPEGFTPPPDRAIFGIRTAVAVAIFARTSGTPTSTSAEIKYRKVEGLRQEKFDAMKNISLVDDGWQVVDSDWRASFIPSTGGVWDEAIPVRFFYPAMSPNVMTGRAWTTSPSKRVLEKRLEAFSKEQNIETKISMFRGSREELEHTYEPLPYSGAYRKTNTVSVLQDDYNEPLKTIPYYFKAFDREYLLADSRAIYRARPMLWKALVDGQIFISEFPSGYPGEGSPLLFNPGIPDYNSLNGRAGRTYPVKTPSGGYNLPEGLVGALEDAIGVKVKPEDVTYYIAGVLGHRGFEKRFRENMQNIGARVPVTANPQIFRTVVDLGKKVVWCHTAGASGDWDGQKKVTQSLPDLDLPRKCTAVMGPGMPNTLPKYNPETETLTFGTGVWPNVSQEVRGYMVGGKNIIDTWAGRRLAKPKGKKTSPLDSIVPTVWEDDWTTEFTELLCTLTRLVSLEGNQEEVLDQIVGGELLTQEDLRSKGVVWPSENTSDNSNFK